MHPLSLKVMTWSWGLFEAVTFVACVVYGLVVPRASFRGGSSPSDPLGRARRYQAERARASHGGRSGTVTCAARCAWPVAKHPSLGR
jgi:hypothetical protein